LERRFEYSTQKRRCGGRPGGTQPTERASTSKAFGKGTTSCKWDSVRAAPSVGRTLTSAPTHSFCRGTFSTSTRTPGAWRRRSALAERARRPRVNRERGDRSTRSATVVDTIEGFSAPFGIVAFDNGQ